MIGHVILFRSFQYFNKSSRNNGFKDATVLRLTFYPINFTNDDGLVRGIGNLVGMRCRQRCIGTVRAEMRKSLKPEGCSACLLSRTRRRQRILPTTPCSILKTPTRAGISERAIVIFDERSARRGLGPNPGNLLICGYGFSFAGINF